MGVLEFAEKMNVPVWNVTGEGPTNSAKLRWFMRYQIYIKAQNIAQKEMDRKAKRIR